MFLPILAAFAAVPHAFALTIRVPGDVATIQIGLDTASSGDTVLVAPGIYAGIGNRDLDFGGKDIVLQSEFGAELTIVDVNATEVDPHVGMLFSHGESSAAMIIGFTITGAYDGGAVCTNSSSPSFFSCVFDGNNGLHGGGALADHASPEFTDCVFSRNSPRTAGGVRLMDSQAAFLRCKFVNNTVQQAGAARILPGSDVTFSQCEFVQNVVGGNVGTVWGGAVICAKAQATFEDCVFADNAALTAPDPGTGKGGAIYGEDATLAIRRCIFVGNQATVGGAIAIEGGSVTIEDSIFRENIGDQGGAMHGLGSVTLTGSTLFKNEAQAGSGLVLFPGWTVALTRVLIAFGVKGEAIACNDPMMISCSDLFGNAGGDWIGCIAANLGTNGNIASDPHFCHTDIGSLAISTNSPCAPEQSGCGLIGAVGPECATAVEPATWGSIKATFGGFSRQKH